MSWERIKLGDFLRRSKIPIDIEDSKSYKRVTIRTKHQGVSVRDSEIGKKIGTKKQFILNEGQFVLSKIDARYGAFGIAPKEVDGTIITGNFWAYDVDKRIMNINWLNQYTNSPIFYDLCERASSGITHRKYLDEDFFLNHELLIPEINEQDSHVIFIEERKDLIGNLENEHLHQLDLLNKLRQQILQDAVQGKLVPQDLNDEPASDLLKRIKAEKEKLISEKKIKKKKSIPKIKAEEIPFEIPSNWAWQRMDDICLKITDGTHHSPTNTEIGEFKYVTAKNIKDGGIELGNITYISKDIHNQIYSRCNPEYGDILYIKDGATTGIVTINNLAEEFSMLSSVALLKLSKLAFNKFLMYSMRSPYFYEATRNDMYGVAITRVTLEKIQNSLIALPPLSEQYRIVAKVIQLMKLCDDLEQSIKWNKKYTQELLGVALKEALQTKLINKEEI